jgi:RNA polymerase sigma factor (sigma-70 family)
LPFLRDVARATRGAALDPDEVDQEAWVALLARLGTHRQDWGRGRFRSWLFVVARNHLSGLGRRAAVRRTSPLAAAAASSIPGTEDDPAVALDRELDRELIRRVLAEFRTQVSEASYRVIHLRWVEGLTISEVAAALRLTPEQVRFRHHRLMKKLRVLAGRRGRGG